jgi:PhzF family phenazine biosynthesis protein
MTPNVHVVTVFGAGPGGGNPAPIVVDAAGISDADMQAVARSYGHESGFVLPAPEDSDCDFELRFWVPNHEMSMCGHATVGAVWLLDRLGRLPSDRVSILTRSGVVGARVIDAGDDRLVEITQPHGRVQPVPDDAVPQILSVLGITARELAPWTIQNACTSRAKTLVPLTSVAILDALRPDFSRIERVCDRIGSTGLYPYAISDPGDQVFDARQFPRSSGYPEDAATGIAAAALSFGLLADRLIEPTSRLIRVRQGRAMEQPSEILLRFAVASGRVEGLWLGGNTRLNASARHRDVS